MYRYGLRKPAKHGNERELHFRNGLLENLWGGVGGGGGGVKAGKVQKKYSRKGKLNEKKFMHAN